MGLIEWTEMSGGCNAYVGANKWFRVRPSMSGGGGWVLDVTVAWFIKQCDDIFPNSKAAKAKAEELFAEWLKSAGLVQRPESCGKCGDSGTKKMWPPVGKKALMTCPCTKDPSSLYSFIRGVKGG